MAVIALTPVVLAMYSDGVGGYRSAVPTVSVPLTTRLIIGGAGSLAISTGSSKAITGQATTSVAGSLTTRTAQSTSLSGQAVTSSIGTLAVRIAESNQLTPMAVTTATTAPTVTTVQSPTVSLTGQSLTSAINTVTVNTGSGSSGQLASGHYINQKMPMVSVSIRPDAETGTFANTAARHRWAYYDGANSVNYQVPVVVQGGSSPFIYSIIAGPAGMTIGQGYLDSGYGIISWTPSGAISSASPTTVTVRVTGQDGNTLDITYTIATSSSTSQFIFLSPTGNDTTGTGTISAPFRSLQKVMGTSETNTTYPKRFVYMRGGSYAAYNRGTGDTGLNSTYQPVVYMAYPGETVNWDATTAQLSINSGDCFFGGSSTSRLIMTGSASNTALETHGITGWAGDRYTFWAIDFVNPVSRVKGNYTNSTSIFSTNNIIQNYWAITGCTETGRTEDTANSTSSQNSMLLHCLFSVQYAVTEYCTAVGQTSSGMIYKDSNRYCSMRFNTVEATNGNGISMGFACQDNNQTSFDCEAGYNWVKGGGLLFDIQGFASAGRHWSYRNTIYRTDTNQIYGLMSNGGTGPYTSENDVVIAKGTNVIGANFTASGTEVQYAWLSGSGATGGRISATNGQLQGTYRTTYLGTRGFELA